MTRGRPGVSKGSSYTPKRNAWMEGEATEVGETEIGISSKAIEGRGSLACWAIADHEQVRIGLRRKANAQVLGRTIVEGDEQPGKKGEPRGAAHDRDAQALAEDLAPTYKQAETTTGENVDKRQMQVVMVV